MQFLSRNDYKTILCRYSLPKLEISGKKNTQIQRNEDDSSKLARETYFTLQRGWF